MPLSRQPCGMRAHPPEIGVVLPFSGFGRRILKGIAAYSRENPHAVFQFIDAWDPSASVQLNSLRADLLLSHLPLSKLGAEAYSQERFLRILGSPDETIPQSAFGFDNYLVGKMAGEELRSRGFDNLAFVGAEDGDFSSSRFDGFVESQPKNSPVEQFRYAEFSYAVHRPVRREIAHRHAKLRTWLADLPKPVGIFAVNDIVALEIMQLCQLDGIDVPGSVAILGVDNDDLVCQLSRSSLSSIRLPYERLGYLAAAATVKLLDSPPPKSRQLSPLEVICRESTDALATSSELIRRASACLRSTSKPSLNVASWAKMLKVPRLALETAFREHFDSTPLTALRDRRVRHARRLILDTHLSIQEIGRICGFSSPIRFAIVFKQLTGESPSDYRNRVQYPYLDE